VKNLVAILSSFMCDGSSPSCYLSKRNRSEVGKKNIKNITHFT
jgi:uncharacterized protein (DUF779 family)